MKLINVTNNHPRLVLNQLESTDAQLVEVYSAGNTSVIYTEAPFHNEIAVINNERAIKDKEINIIKKFFQRKMKNFNYDIDNIYVTKEDNLVEISIPHEHDLISEEV
jgi:hypothetical protein